MIFDYSKLNDPNYHLTIDITNSYISLCFWRFGIFFDWSETPPEDHE